MKKATAGCVIYITCVYVHMRPSSPPNVHKTLTYKTNEQNKQTKQTNQQFPAVLIDKGPGQLLKSLLTDSSTGGDSNVTVALFQRAAAPWAFASDRCVFFFSYFFCVYMYIYVCLYIINPHIHVYTRMYILTSHLLKQPPP
jgi:hypothetical protein